MLPLVTRWFPIYNISTRPCSSHGSSYFSSASILLGSLKLSSISPRWPSYLVPHQTCRAAGIPSPRASTDCPPQDSRWVLSVPEINVQAHNASTIFKDHLLWERYSTKSPASWTPRHLWPIIQTQGISRQMSQYVQSNHQSPITTTDRSHLNITIMTTLDLEPTLDTTRSRDPRVTVTEER